MRYRNYTKTIRDGDWLVGDDVLGGLIYASEAKKLHAFTGLGGQVTHIRDYNPPIDQSLVPFKSPVEKPANFQHGNSPHSSTTFTLIVFDGETTDPLSISNPRDEIGES